MTTYDEPRPNGVTSFLDWATLPRLLWDTCDGHVSRGVTVYGLDRPGRSRGWFCRSCYVDAWLAAGKPVQAAERNL